MKVKIINLFPKAAMHFNVERSFTDEELALIMTYENATSNNMGNLSTEDVDILRLPEMSDIKKIIQDALDMYFLHMYQPKNPKEIRLTLTQSWLNFTKQGEHHHIHLHPNSIISGCLYINAKKDVDSIVFKNSEFPYFQIEKEKDNEYNTFTSSIFVETGDIVLFPSNTLHMVPTVTDPHTRISLAFNSFFRGKLGNVSTDKVNYLEIR